MKRITINTSVQYDVIMEEGILDDAGMLISEVLPLSKVCIVTDENVNRLFGKRLEESLEAAGFDVTKAVFPAGEETKSISALSDLLEYLAEKQFTRNDLLVALGGGVIGDLTGFTAATFLRGIPFVQIPTSLLSAVDASVGGKTAINLKAGKNLAGAFWQPSMVIFDPALLSELPGHEFLDGLAEVIKCGVIADNDLFTFVSRREEPEFTPFIETCVERSIMVKKELVERDEFDTGQRQLLNFGHTIGHAIEKCSRFAISHGHAVARGMLIAARASYKMGWSRYDCSAPIRNVLEDYEYPLDCPYTCDQLTDAALRDKKRHGTTMNLVVPLLVGECALMEIPVDNLRDFIAAGLEQPEQAD